MTPHPDFEYAEMWCCLECGHERTTFTPNVRYVMCVRAREHPNRRGPVTMQKTATVASRVTGRPDPEREPV